MGDERATRVPRSRAAVALVAIAAVVMGLPTLRGGFVGGDDHRLLLNHVLVNHPSFSHALELFTIVHRDLYQPLPLLSFSMEFAVADALGLFDRGEDAAARLFHLTNIVLHAANAVLVWFLVASLHSRLSGRCASSAAAAAPTTSASNESSGARAIATVAALLFAVHPLQMEVIAWTNGRMMLMSTLFALASLLSFTSWLDRGRSRDAFLTVAFVLFSSISKVRIGLPVLLLVVAMARRGKLSKRFLPLWIACGVVTGALVLVNVRATAGADLFAQGAEHLKGPRTVRVLLALACYFQHLVWPAGLASYYPTPPVASWSDPSTWRAAMIVIPSLAGMTWACLRSQAARLGVLWFFATLASTLPFFPARNILAADRYMYLPIVGLFWLIAAHGCAARRRLTAAWSPIARKAFTVLLAATVVPPMIGTGWHVASFYETPARKTARIAALFPDTPRVWEKLGWCHYSQGDYERAVEFARRELRHDSPQVRSGAYQLLGMTELRRGNADRALELLHEAIEIDPKSALGRYRLALAYQELGRTGEAIPHFEAAVEAAPGHNPTLNRLASVYRRAGRSDDARAMYEKALANNRYEVPAVMALAEMEIETGTRASYQAAERRLLDLLDWMPENTEALTNLGVARAALGRPREAIKAYEKALAMNPGRATAALNLAQLYHRSGDAGRARPLFERAVAAGLESIDQAAVVHDFFISQDDPQRAVELWRGVLKLFPDSVAAREFLAWSFALSGGLQQAKAECDAMTNEAPASPLVLATLAYVGLSTQRYETATTRAAALCDTGDDGVDARRRLLAALDRFDQKHPSIPWTFCLATQLLIADGNLRGADLFIRLCEERCTDPPCREQVHSLRSQIRNISTPSNHPKPGPP